MLKGSFNDGGLPIGLAPSRYFLVKNFVMFAVIVQQEDQIGIHSIREFKSSNRHINKIHYNGLIITTYAS